MQIDKVRFNIIFYKKNYIFISYLKKNMLSNKNLFLKGNPLQFICQMNGTLFYKRINSNLIINLIY